MQAATIKLFLAEGSPDGIRTGEISNWTGKAIAGPRSNLSELLKREELGNPGVYFLSGVDPDTDEPSLYIGEAETVSTRLKQHRAKDDWVQVIAFVSKDENLTKAHIRYLEGELIKLGNATRQLIVRNNAGSGAKLPESDQAEMDVFLDKIMQLLPVMGITSLRAPSESPELEDGLLFASIKGLKAKGRRTADGFVVYKGSQAVLSHRPSAKYSKKGREVLIVDGLLPEEGECRVFAQDVVFSSPSAAGAAITGGATNGLTFWRSEEGVSLKELEVE